MKSFIVFALFVAVAVAVPVNPNSTPEGSATVLRQESDNIGVSEFRYIYETSNGISAQEEGQLVNVGSEDEGIAVRGTYSYTGPDNVVYTVTYVADKNGFQPSGAHIPQA